MAGRDEVSFLFKCVKEGKITGDEAIDIIGKGRLSATTGAIMRYGPNHSILIYLQLDSNHIIVPNVFVYVIPEHTSRADCSVNNNNNNNNPTPQLQVSQQPLSCYTY